MDEIILMSDPRVTALPVRECGERLVDIRQDDLLLLDQRSREDSDSFFYMRAGLRDRLHRAAAALPRGLRLLVIEAYRPLALQRHHFEQYAATLSAARPDWTRERVRTAASRYVSPPEVAPHVAGAAVDLTLADGAGRELDLGTEVDASPEESAGACYTAATNIGAQACEHRKIMGDALSGAGLVNYPTEWWHWSYGDRYWAMVTGAGAARYGPAEPAAGAVGLR